MHSQKNRNEIIYSLYDFLKSRKDFLAKAMQNKSQTICFAFFSVTDMTDVTDKL
jgi:hypothetical protein